MHKVKSWEWFLFFDDGYSILIKISSPVVLRVKPREQQARIHAPIAIQVTTPPFWMNKSQNLSIQERLSCLRIVLCTGKYSSMPGATSCDSCMSGRYTSDKGMSNCTKCSTGKISSEGAKTCTSCASGFYSEMEGSASCSACSSGTFASNSSSTSCEKWPATKIV